MVSKKVQEQRKQASTGEILNNTFFFWPGKVKVKFIRIRQGKHNEYGLI